MSRTVDVGGAGHAKCLRRAVPAVRPLSPFGGGRRRRRAHEPGRRDVLAGDPAQSVHHPLAAGTRAEK